MKEKLDMRIIRTRKSIGEAFLRLMREKSYEKITIQDIADEAYVNRNTFYLHYMDREDLMQQLTVDSFKLLDELIPSYPVDVSNPNYVKSLIHEVLKAIQEKRNFYMAMMQNSGTSFFNEEFKLFIMKRMYWENEENDNKGREVIKDVRLQFYMEYIISGMLGVILYSFKEQVDLSESYISEVVFALVYKNLLDFM